MRITANLFLCAAASLVVLGSVKESGAAELRYEYEEPAPYSYEMPAIDWTPNPEPDTVYPYPYGDESNSVDATSSQVVTTLSDEHKSNCDATLRPDLGDNEIAELVEQLIRLIRRKQFNELRRSGLVPGL